MRSFLACVVGRPVADRLHADLEPMRHIYTGAAYRWVPPANYHVTLRFFGELNAAQVDRINALIGPVAASTARVECRASAARALPGTRKPNVIVLPIASGGRLEALAADCGRVLDGVFGPPDKPFKAHLTVIRCGRGARFFEPAEDFDFPLAFTRIALFESSAGNGTPKYTPLREFRLA